MERQTMFMDREAQHRKDSNSWQNDPLMHFLSESQLGSVQIQTS